jgi:hypothetical protein
MLMMVNLGHFCDAERNHFKDAHWLYNGPDTTSPNPWPRHEMCSGEATIMNTFESGKDRWEGVPCECACHKTPASKYKGELVR